MPDNVIETLTVELTAEYDKLLAQTKEGVGKAEKELDKLSNAPKKTQGALEQLGGFLSGKFLSILTSVGVAMAAAFSVNSIVNFFGALIKGSIDANASFEVFITQFSTLLGSVEKAQARIKELSQFSLTTPFELPEIVEADRLLQTFGGTALATGENLRRIGDSAAAVNAGFKEVSFWTGRMYSSMLAGRPFGEASARLQELGIMSGTVRTKLEDMQKAGASGEELWAAYSEMIDTKFAGAMDKLSKTLQGVMSNLSDFQGMLLREGGAELFEGVRADAVEFFELIDKNREPLIDLAKALGSIADKLREAVTSPILEQLADIKPEQIRGLADSFENLGTAVGKLAQTDTSGLSGIVDTISGLVEGAATITETVNLLKDIGLTISGIKPLNEALGVDLLAETLKASNPLLAISDGVHGLNEAVKELTGLSISEWVGGETASLKEQTEAAEAAKGAYSGMRDGMREAADAAQELKDAEAAKELEAAAKAAEEAAEAIANAKDALEGLAAGFQDLQTETSEKLQELEADHGEKITEIDKDFADKQTEIAKGRADDLLKLEKDTAEKRQEIQDDTQDALAKLEKETADKREEINERAKDDLAKLADESNSQVDKLREEHHKKEERETQDHQRDMQRLQDQYLFDLQDAVTARDARAIVNLRRRFQMEKREKETSFKTDQRRENEDLGDRIGDIRSTERNRRQEILKSQRDQLADLEDSEADKRAEILASQGEQLADLAKNEAKKRAEIEASYQEQMAKAEEQHAEQLARENERYEERRTALNEAMQKRLEDEAKALADQKDITEEGARAILESLSKVFGIDGDIDALMNEFKERRREKMVIQIEFDKQIGGEDKKSRRSSGIGTGQGQGSHPGQIPGFQFGGIVPGSRGMPQMIMAHGGEEIVPVNEVARLNQMRQGMGGGGGEMRVKLDISGSAPPGIRAGEVDAISATLVRALKEAGINARR